jgi:hypothetical protein
MCVIKGELDHIKYKFAKIIQIFAIKVGSGLGSGSETIISDLGTIKIDQNFTRYNRLM